MRKKICKRKFLKSAVQLLLSSRFGCSQNLAVLLHVLQRKVSKNSSLVRAVALATAGSGILCFTTSDYNTSVLVSISSTFRDSLKWPWRSMEEYCHHSWTPSNHLRYGIQVQPLFFSKPDSLPEPNVSKEAASDAGDCPKHGRDCLRLDTIANAAAKIGPAVVNLAVQGSRGSIGSGIIIDEGGTILTCAHVLVDFQGFFEGKVDVTLQDGRSFEGTVLNIDFHSDVAIVKIISKTPLPVAKLGSSSKVRPGDLVLAMGSMVTAGTVSCIDRKSSDLGLGGMRREYLRTDCAIYKGNFGGPLVNADGEVVGVNIMKILGADALNFAAISELIEHYKSKGRVGRLGLGLQILDLNDMNIAFLKERNASFPDVNRGVLIVMVWPGSPADRAGFHPGDVLVEFGGRPIASAKEVIEMGDNIGKTFKAVVKREKNVTVTLSVISDEANPEM